MTLATWDRLLDELEHGLDAVEAALAAGDEVVVAELVVPEGMGHMPLEVGPRAMAIQHRLQEVELALTLAAQRARQAMVLGDSSPAAGPSLIDHRG
jgi:hypothetical protein